MQLLEDGDRLLNAIEQDPHTTITLGTPGVVGGVRVDTIVAQSHTGLGERRDRPPDRSRRSPAAPLRAVVAKRRTSSPFRVAQTFRDVHGDPALPAGYLRLHVPTQNAVAEEEHPAGADADPAAVAADRRRCTMPAGP